MAGFEIPKTFKVSDKSVYFPNVPACIMRAIEHLDKLPFKELLTTRQLAAAVGIAPKSFQDHGTEPSISEYRAKIGNKGVFWGSKATIKELNRAMKGQQ